MESSYCILSLDYWKKEKAQMMFPPSIEKVN